MLQAEWMHIEEDMSLGATGTSVGHDGGYLAYQRVLFGAINISFKGVTPELAFDPYEGSGRGALALALRASVLDCDEALRDAGLVVPGQFTERVTSLWVGLNWYMSSHALLRTSYVHSSYSDNVMLAAGSTSGEDALLVELQLHF